MLVPAALAVLSIGAASDWPTLWLLVAWPLGTLAVLGVLLHRARALGEPPSISLVARMFLGRS